MSEVDKAMANSPTYLRVAAERMQEDNVKDLAGALKPVVDSLREVAARLAALTVAQRDVGAEIKDAMLVAMKANTAQLARVAADLKAIKAPEPFDPMPVVRAMESSASRTAEAVSAALEKSDQRTVAAIEALEGAIMAPVRLVNSQAGRPVGAEKVRR